MKVEKNQIIGDTGYQEHWHTGLRLNNNMFSGFNGFPVRFGIVEDTASHPEKIQVSFEINFLFGAYFKMHTSTLTRLR